MYVYTGVTEAMGDELVCRKCKKLPAMAETTARELRVPLGLCAACGFEYHLAFQHEKRSES